MKDHLEAELDISNHKIFKADRSRPRKRKHKGRDSGGVAFYIRNDITTYMELMEVLVSYSNGVNEMLCLYSKSLNLIVTVVYRQPDDSAHGNPSGNYEFKMLLSELHKAILSIGSPTPNIIVGGDFNLPHTQWNNCTPAKGCPKREKLMIWSLHDFVGTFGLHQVVSQPTHKDGNLLDCEFVNNEELVFDVNVNQVLRSVSHHSIVELSTPIHVKPQLIRDVEEAEKSGFHALNYFHSSVQWDDTADEFKQIDWDSRLSSSSATDALESIYKVCY